MTAQRSTPRRDTRARALFSDLTQGLSTAEVRKLVDRDATRAYSVLLRDDEPAPASLSGPKRLVRDVRLLFLSVATKLSPARRLLFLLAIGAALLGFLDLDFVWADGGKRFSLGGSNLFFFVSIGGLLFLLSVEMVDRVLVRDELQIARQLQRDLLPKSSPDVPGFSFAHSSRTANDIGGDYYRFEPLPDGRLAIVVADASGHGMAAGLLMAIADATLHVAIDIDPAPLAVARRLHGALRRTSDRRSFLTLFYGLLDPATGEIDYVCAGHPPPLLRRASGAIEELSLGSFPLGLRDPLAPASGRMRLGAGDLLLLFTDGLFEALGGAGDAFGFDRLRGALAPATGAEDAHRRVSDAFANHVGDAPLEDDLTLLAIGVDSGLDRSRAGAS